MIVYVVTSGAYSDYGIRRMFLNRDDAQRFCDVENGARAGSSYDDNRIEEWEVDESLPDHVIWHSLFLDVVVPETDIYGHSQIAWGDERVPNDDVQSFERTSYPRGQFTTTILWAQGPNRERLEKALRDKRAQILAERAGIT